MDFLSALINDVVNWFKFTNWLNLKLQCKWKSLNKDKSLKA